ncbi:MAG TPA: sigma-70 family RNA polymerase sigma factor [Gemmataceae bacterium]
MGDALMEQNLANTSTLWSLVTEANHGPEDAARRARETLLERYKGAVYRYLLGALHDSNAADDLAQEFFLRFVRGDLRNANPEKGRFRDLVKTTLFHLIVDYQRRRKGQPQPLPPDDCGPAASEDSALTSEEQFLDSWRQQLLSQAWKALRARDTTYYAVLRLRAEKNDLSSAEMAERLSEQLGNTVSADWVRTRLKRAREQFADLLLDELIQSMDNPTRERLEEELADLRLLMYCQDAVARRGG